ncbi:hypothetical protein MUK42_29767 [Musa troglodytarum]|uniref:Uncharacterized protein n=1 Tax=Musa troglodytarum TaxID=320322 RepID=A0A9E7JYP7_9LILI|nr:hypothetical protein MUK42_29767 [Musa troglodytarum]
MFKSSFSSPLLHVHVSHFNPSVADLALQPQLCPSFRPNLCRRVESSHCMKALVKEKDDEKNPSTDGGKEK